MALPLTSRYSSKNQQGFTLVEMSIVILILGLVVGAIFAFMEAGQERQKRETTTERQRKVAQALAYFAQSNGRLPCPATPDIDETHNDYGIERNSCTTVANSKGLVPFRTLGLTQLDVTDGYDRPFTYAVSDAARNISSSTDVHPNCRSNGIWVISGSNVNTAKARFCCRQATGTSQIQVYRNNNTTANDMAHRNQPNPPAGRSSPSGFGNVDTVATPNTAHYLPYFAYILVSHGANGFGSYRFPVGTTHSNTTMAFPGTSSALERANADTNMNYVDALYSRSQDPINSHFDDIVLWRTQEQVIMEFGNDSCARP